MEYVNSDILEAVGRAALICTIAVLSGFLIQHAMLKAGSRFQRLFRIHVGERIMERLHLPLLFLLVSIALQFGLPFMELPEPWMGRIALTLKVVNVAFFGWLGAALTYVLAAYLEARHIAQEDLKDQDARNTIRSRRFTTQVHLLRRVMTAVIISLTAIGIVLVIPGLRQLGLSLFASAGVAGIILGIAAKTVLSNVIAGVQLALTQPILLGDEVQVNDQAGTIEEINANYVVVRTWDLRRLIIPLNYFMENTFENHSYHDPGKFGAVMLYTDYTADIDAIRAEAKRAAENSPHWDRKRFDMTVSNSKENVLELRVAVSAQSSAKLWKLQCEIREKLVKYLQRTQTEALPQTRLKLIVDRGEEYVEL